MGGKLLNLVKTVMRRHYILWSGRKEPPMHYGRRSDLALEAKELFESSAGKTTQLPVSVPGKRPSSAIP